LEGLFAAIEASQLSAALRRSLWIYPAINLAHLAGLVMLVGGIGVIDLRLIGLGRAIPFRPLSRMLTTIAAMGLVLMTISGALMFASDPVELAKSGLFQIKMILVVVGLLNALAFRRLFAEADRPPLGAKAMAVLSLAIWLTAAGLGRWVGYT
jgi:hypothetical protein